MYFTPMVLPYFTSLIYSLYYFLFRVRTMEGSKEKFLILSIFDNKRRSDEFILGIDSFYKQTNKILELKKKKI